MSCFNFFNLCDTLHELRCDGIFPLRIQTRARPCICQSGRPDALRLPQVAGPPLNHAARRTYVPVHSQPVLATLSELALSTSDPRRQRFHFQGVSSRQRNCHGQVWAPVHFMMQMGLWKTLKYVSPDALDEGVFWREVANEAEEE